MVEIKELSLNLRGNYCITLGIVSSVVHEFKTNVTAAQMSVQTCMIKNPCVTAVIE